MTIAKPSLPDTVIRFTGTPAPRIPPAAADTVAIPLTHDWGPVGSDAPGASMLDGGPQLLDNFAEWTGIFGDSDTPGRTAVAGGFAGQGLPGAGGAGGVLAYRTAGASAAKATVTLTGVGAGTPPTLRLDGRYVGSRGNRLTVTVDTDPANAAQDRLRIYLDGVQQEVYSYAAPSLAAFVSVINAHSQLVRATALVADALPAPRLTQHTPTPVALIGGDDGATLTSTDHLNALAGIAYKQFGILAPMNLTDSAIQSAYQSWVQGQAAANMPVRLVLGGAAGETLDAAISRSSGFNDEHVLNVGGGTFHDDLLDKDLSTAELAPRIAGILAAKGDSHSITFSRIGGLHVVVAPAANEIDLAVRSGVVVLVPTSSPDADLKIEKGVTTYTTPNVASKPLDVFSDARLVGIMDTYVRQMSLWGDEKVIGDLPVNDDSRASVRGQARKLEDELLRRGLILPGDDVTIPKPWVVCEDPHDPALADALPYSFGWQFARTANAILGEGRVL